MTQQGNDPAEAKDFRPRYETFTSRFLSASSVERRALIAELFPQTAPQGSWVSMVSRAFTIDAGATRAALEDLHRAGRRDRDVVTALAFVLDGSGDLAAACKVMLELLTERKFDVKTAFDYLRLVARDPAPHAASVQQVLRALPPSITRDSYALMFQGALGVTEQPVDASAFRATVRSEAAALFAQYRGGQTALARFYAAIDGVPSAVLVGNGPSLKGRGLGEAIDGAPMVARCNFPAISGHEADVGARSDVVFFTNFLKDRVASVLIPRHPSFKDAWLVTFPNVQDDAFQKPPSSPGAAERFCSIPPAVLTLLIRVGYSGATTGFRAAIFLAMLWGKPVTAYGFDFYEGAHHLWNTKMKTANPGLNHKPPFERMFFEHVLAPHFGLDRR